MDRFELSLELLKIKALSNCLDDALERAMLGNSSPEGDKAISLVILLQEHLDKLLDSVDHSGRDVA